MRCPTNTCSAEVEPGQPHRCPGTKPAPVTREEFETLRGAVTALMTSMTTPVRDAAFARGATDALVIRVATLERVTNAIWTCADKDTNRIDALSRFVKFTGEETNTVAQAVSALSDSDETSQAVAPAGGSTTAHAPDYNAAFDALSCLIDARDEVLADLRTSRPFTTREVTKLLRRLDNIDNGGGGHGAAGDSKPDRAVDPAASALPPLPERPGELDEPWKAAQFMQPSLLGADYHRDCAEYEANRMELAYIAGFEAALAFKAKDSPDAQA